MRKFTRIEGDIFGKANPSDIVQLPRLGKVRLGVVVQSQRGTEYPREVDYFVCPPEVQAVYGDRPKTLDIMFPVEDETIVFPQFLGAYGGNHKLLCHGNAKEAERWDQDKKGWVAQECPCDWYEKGKCAKRGNLMVVLPRVNLAGIYQIDSGSFVTMVNLNSYFRFLRPLVGRISWVPLKLVREATQMRDPDGKQQTHFPLKIVFDGTADVVAELRKQTAQIREGAGALMLDEPVIEGPLPDTPRVKEEDLATEGANSKLNQLTQNLKQETEEQQDQNVEASDNGREEEPPPPKETRRRITLKHSEPPKKGETKPLF